METAFASLHLFYGAAVRHCLLSSFCELNHGHSVSLSKANLNNNEKLTKQQNTELAMASFHNATVLKDHFGVEGDLKGC